MAALLVGGCAAFDPGPPPLTRADVVQLSKSGETPAALVARLQSTGTVLWLSAADIIELRDAGVSPMVLDYLQAAQLADMRRRAQFEQLLYGPERTPFSRCGGFPPSGGRFNGFFAPFC
ncbi:MAG: hypothetical protein ABI630_02305 [Betaproteobacteria bacterium]